MDKDKDKKTYISTNLKYLRTTNNKSLNEIAKVCEKTDVAVYYWENGAREPNAVDIAKLSNYYNISIDDLLLKDLRFLNADSAEKNNDDELEIYFSKIRELSPRDKEIVKGIVDSISKEIEESGK